MDQFIDWLYGQIVGFLSTFFTLMGNMGAELFDMGWVQSIVLFFSYLAWALYGTGLVVAIFETGIEYQNGRGNIKEAALSTIKGFMAVSLFTTVPVELYKLSISLQSSFTAGITGYGESFGNMASDILAALGNANTSEALASGAFGGLSEITNVGMLLLVVVMMGYAVIAVFFSNIKRGGILLVQIAVGSMYMFSLPRSYIDGFVQWCKQVIGLCLTAFLQATILAAGLMVLREHALLGLGLMLSATEIPRIAGVFGVDTSVKSGLRSAVSTVQTAVNTTRTVVQAIAR